MSFTCSALRAPAALRRRLHLCASFLPIALIALPIAPASAQTQLTPVVVTASREPQPLARTTADVVVIDAERIRASTADSVEDLLRREAGLQISRNGAAGHSAAVFIRGASASNTVVLVDGVRIGSATLGQAGLDALGLSQIDRIEVLRGPGSSLYGADAVGGVVQIFTKRGDGPTRFFANVALGGYRSSDGSLGASGSQGSFDYAASLGRESSRGVSTLKPGDQFGNYNPDNDGFRRDSGQVKLGYTLAPGHRVGFNLVQTRLDAQYDDSEFLPPNFAQDASPDFRSKLDTRVTSVDYRGEISPAWTTSAQFAANLDDLISGGTVTDRFRTRREQLTLQAAWKPVAEQQLVMAYERLVERADSTQYANDEKRINHAVVLGYTGQFGAHVMQADLRHDDNSVYGGQTTGRLGWGMELAKNLRLRALVGTTFRAPSFNELFYPNYGVPTVQPEHGRSAEIGLDWRPGNGSEAALTVYQNRVREMIGYEPNSALCPPSIAYQFGCARNIGRARLQGATLTGAHRWGAWQLRATVDVLDARDLDTNQRLARRAAHQESVSADYDAGAWTFGAALLAVGSRPDGTAQLASYETLDLRARWRFAPQWQLEAKLLNATDRTVEPARDYQSLGRQAWIGIRFDSVGL